MESSNKWWNASISGVSGTPHSKHTLSWVLTVLKFQHHVRRDGQERIVLKVQSSAEGLVTLINELEDLGFRDKTILTVLTWLADIWSLCGWTINGQPRAKEHRRYGRRDHSRWAFPYWPSRWMSYYCVDHVVTRGENESSQHAEDHRWDKSEFGKDGITSHTNGYYLVGS
jgi:hypothetical protein